MEVKKTGDFQSRLCFFLELEVNKNPAEIFIILLDAMIKFFDMSLIQKPQNFFLELSAAFAGNDLNELDPFFNGFVHDPVQFDHDSVAIGEDAVEVEFEFDMMPEISSIRRADTRSAPTHITFAILG